jgi:HK97 gp10 family phage protein
LDDLSGFFFGGVMAVRSRIDAIRSQLDEQIDPGLRRVAEEIADEARSRVPVNTGRLKAAIHVEDNDDGYRVVFGDGDAWYGHIVEGGGAHTPARPFAVPAVEAVRSRIDEIIAMGMRDL